MKHPALTPRPPSLLKSQQQAVIQKWDFDLSIREVWRYICFFEGYGGISIEGNLGTASSLLDRQLQESLGRGDIAVSCLVCAPQGIGLRAQRRIGTGIMHGVDQSTNMVGKVWRKRTQEETGRRAKAMQPRIFQMVQFRPF